MKNQIILFLSIISFFSLVSCEKVIDVDLNENNPLMVIDGGLTGRQSPDTIKLSWTGSYFGDGNFSPVTGANVNVSDDIGNSENLKEVAPGFYVIENFKGRAGGTYHLSINANSKTYTASSKMLNPVEITQLTYRYKDRSLGTREGNYVTAYFDDPAGTQNYYLIKASGTNVSFNNGSDQFFVLNDELFDGGMAAIEIPFIHFERGLAEVELFSIDKIAFNYYTSLNEIIQNPGPSPFSGVPQNSAKSNIQGDAVGFFQTFSLSKAIIKIP
jgi:hypothetical protein